MRIGKLNLRALLQRPVRGTDDGMGGASSQYQTIDTIWISAEPWRGGEEFKDLRLQGRMVFKLVMRYRTDVDESMRLVAGNLIWQIVSVPFDPTGKGQELHMHCEQIR